MFLYVAQGLKLMASDSSVTAAAQGLKLMASYSSVTAANPISKNNGWNN